LDSLLSKSGGNEVLASLEKKIRMAIIKINADIIIANVLL
jgi:hypothetical protein